MTEIEILEKSLVLSKNTLIVSIAVSILSIFIGVISLIIQRSHNLKSVRPYCEIIKRKYENQIEIVLINRGLGPMIIDNIIMLENKTKTIIKKYPIDLLPEDITYDTYSRQLENCAIPSMEEKSLIKFTIKYLIDDEKIRRIREILKNYTIRIKYKDIYGKVYYRSENLESYKY